MKNQNAILCILLGICLGLLIGRKTSGQTEIKEIIKTDTLTRITIDTVEVPEPIPVLVEILDTIYIDRVVGNESDILIRQTKTYKDSTYTATISGYNPSLDYIETYNTVKSEYIYVTEIVREELKKWHIGLYADVRVYERIYAPVGAKMTYRNDRWELSGKVGKDLVTNNIVFEVGYNFDLIRF